MSDLIYQDPNKDVHLSKPMRGDIVCRKLTIGKNASLLGNVRAINVQNHGRFQGNVVAQGMFSNCPTGIFRGTVRSANLAIHPDSVFEASNTRKLDGVDETPPVLASMSFIERAVEDGIRRQIIKTTATAREQKNAQTPDGLVDGSFAFPDAEALPTECKDESPVVEPVAEPLTQSVPEEKVEQETVVAKQVASDPLLELKRPLNSEGEKPAVSKPPAPKHPSLKALPLLFENLG